MAEFASHHLWLRLPDEKGVTKLSSLTRFSKKTGKPHPDLKPPKVDPSVMYLWRWFLDLDESRDENKPIPNTELQAWMQINHRTLTRWQVEALRAIDHIWRFTHAKGTRWIPQA